MVAAIISEKKGEFEKAVEHLRLEAGKLRTGRANPALVEDLLVDYYGTKTPLKQMASVNVPEPRQIAIQPWDRGALSNIEAAVRESDLGLNPVNDGVAIRINIPTLTEERRRDLVRVLNQKTEEARVKVRSVREETWKEIQEAEKNGTIGEDDKFQGKDKLQEIVDDYNKKLEALRVEKEKEIMTV